MSNYSLTVRVRRWAKYLINTIDERIHGLDFSMVYVGDLQRSQAEIHGYSMTDAGDMKRILQAIPVKASESAFLDIGCGKGMCMKCAAELGYRKVAGLDLDKHLLGIARTNMRKLQLDVDCISASAVEFDRYQDYDVFYFYNPFGAATFQQVINRLIESQRQRGRNIWVAYYHPVFGQLFEDAGFQLKKVVHDITRDTVTKIYCYPLSVSNPLR